MNKLFRHCVNVSNVRGLNSEHIVSGGSSVGSVNSVSNLNNVNSLNSISSVSIESSVDNVNIDKQFEQCKQFTAQCYLHL